MSECPISKFFQQIVPEIFTLKLSMRRVPQNTPGELSRRTETQIEGADKRAIRQQQLQATLLCSASNDHLVV
jgi:hypothetical protein